MNLAESPAFRRGHVVLNLASLLLMFAAAVAADRGLHIFDVMLPAGLLYFSHILPAVILAWKEKMV